ncbi:MAG: hypothetical protein Q8N60_01085, partial [Candidatus Diapherotrites archaeon]|nr:hypothetical protein [Candidatus Diapherotrites archaeon]
MKKAILISLIAIAAIVSESGSLSFECGDGSCNRLFEDAVSSHSDCAPMPTENCGNGAIAAG